MLCGLRLALATDLPRTKNDQVISTAPRPRSPAILAYQ